MALVRGETPIEPIRYKQRLYYLGSDCYGEWVVDQNGRVFDRYVGGGYTFKPTTYEKLLEDRQKQLNDIEKDIRAIKAIQRKVAEGKKK